MVKQINATINGQHREVKEGHITINGVYRELTGGFITINGVYRQFYPFFPEQPTSYNLKQTFNNFGEKFYTAPCDGWYMVEIFGAAGQSSNSVWNGDGEENDTYGGLFFWNDNHEPKVCKVATGGGGGGGAYCCSKLIALNKGDQIRYNVNMLTKDSEVDIRNSTEYNYSSMECTCGGNSIHIYTDYPVLGGLHGGTAGEGGKASGGNFANINGGDGEVGKTHEAFTLTAPCRLDPSKGGAAAHPDGLAGGDSGGFECKLNTDPDYADFTYCVGHCEGYDSGQNFATYGFCRIYGGNTNEV